MFLQLLTNLSFDFSAKITLKMFFLCLDKKKEKKNS